jgi:TRAP transporter TAXI family solute receptor
MRHTPAPVRVVATTEEGQREKSLKSALAASAILGVVGLPVAAAAEDFINILTGGTGGAYYPIGVGLSKVYAEKIPNVRPTVQSTPASVANLNLLQEGKGELALALGDSVALGWKGDTEAGFKAPLDKLRGVAAAYPNHIQLVATKDSGIKSITDLKGKRLSVGAPRSGTELNTRAIFAAAGMSYSDLGKIEYLPFNESVELMKNRQLDATLQSVALGGAAIRDLANSIDITMVAVPSAIVSKIGAPYVPAIIPAKTYKGQDADVQTAAVINFFVSHSGVKDDLVYNMTKTMFENLPTLAASHSAVKAMNLAEALSGMPIPLHAGAKRYFDEKGIK